MDLLKVTDTAKKATDPVLLAALASRGIDKDGVELTRDYASRAAGGSPYHKLYRDLNSGLMFAVVSGLPMVDAYGQRHEIAWTEKNGIFASGNNIFHAIAQDNGLRIVTLSEQPGGLKRDAELVCYPQLFIGEGEVKPVSPRPRLLETDPANGNYHYNVLEWDYGVCRRLLRLIEGRIIGSWVFQEEPSRDVRIKYHQQGDFRLKLGQYRLNDDEELVSGDAFKSPGYGLPFIVSDTAAFYPDAHSESATVDGYVYEATNGQSWSAKHGAASGSGANDSGAANFTAYLQSHSVTDQWNCISRAGYLFDTSSLGSGAVISGAVFSIYCYANWDTDTFNQDAGLVSFSPSSSIGLAVGDYAQFGVTDLAARKDLGAIQAAADGYQDWTLNSSGLSAIDKTGISKFGLRFSADIDNSISWASGASILYAYFAEQGTGYKPKLVVTFTPAGDNKSSSDNGSGTDVIVLRSQETNEQGGLAETASSSVSITGLDMGGGTENSALDMPGNVELIFSGDAGGGTDALKMKIGRSGHDAKLQGQRGQLEIPQKELNL